MHLTGNVRDNIKLKPTLNRLNIKAKGRNSAGAATRYVFSFHSRILYNPKLLTIL